MKNNKISGFQWAMTIFVFFVITMALSIMLRDFQSIIGVKHFIFEVTDLAPLIAAIICILVFKYKKVQLAGLKFSISLKVIERLLLALILPLIILIIGMYSFNTFADSFILLQSTGLSVPITHILIGHILMAFVVEFGFRSYLQNIVETKMNTFFASIVVGLMYSVFSANTTYGTEFAAYNFLYTFSFSMILGELIRATKGRTIYIATTFHASMTFGLIFLFSEEIGDLFSIKVIAISTAIVAVGYIGLSLIIRGIAYLTTRRNLEELEPNNYLDHVNDDEETNHTRAEKSSSNIKDAEKTGVSTASTVGIAKSDTENTVADEPSIHEGTEKTEPQHHIDNQTESNHDEDHDITSESVESAESVKHTLQSDDLTNDSNEDEKQSLKEPATYKEDRRSSVVIDAEKHIEKTEEQSSDKNK
ncbi:TPA: CPBP family intramembrane metalloprotease SdpC [Staphylococcus aureus]|uniref:Lysostaphin resistance protein A n=1 Tax=Staphylococcus aureus (strain bovine RF122 / ET3-1) TaxID=273036 RepID=LYRA_STAAB|nr:CPBP family intramembrane glutamic endopeptidase SdpC [Staphylococcus aureus]Q2YYX7.1 RecName: Full=Lysostaphin resistance protein A [Staphylococcus aureus RF122]MBI0976812.1 CPBP family intramembrane metalloprotease SdpC [Staphylococcus aureus]MBU9752350.1 CPBP family intramembrane metalloprotease SdpC [Staphylococcus aureus]MBU9757306.1 CPBP family intramembrane metalloprotease SdpC [Staphylococcus aureus]MBU9778666.1 CPBP family intramembrane metalloprotease SdpC [Staphylococcus aureus]